MKQSHTRAFFIEGALLTLFLLVSLAILIQVYGKARQTAETAARETAAALILQNAEADFASGADGYTAAGTLMLRYSADGTQNADGPYDLMANITEQPTAAGTLLQAELAVAYEGEPVAELTTTRYVSGRAAA